MATWNSRGLRGSTLEDLINRTQLSTTLCKKLDNLGVLKGLDDSNQMSLF